MSDDTDLGDNINHQNQNNMTEEEIKATLAKKREKEQKEKEARWNYFYNKRIDYTEFDPPVEHRDNVLTQNSYIEHNLHNYKDIDESIKSSFYYVTDDIYTEERNSDPCPFPPDTSAEWKEGKLYCLRGYIEDSHSFVEGRKSNYQFFIRILMFIGMFSLLGFAHSKPLTALYALGILWIVMPALHFLVPVYYLAPFSKRKRNFIRAYRYYLNWSIRESKRRHRLGLRNAIKYGLRKPTFWQMIAHPSCFYYGNTYFSD